MTAIAESETQEKFSFLQTLDLNGVKIELVKISAKSLTKLGISKPSMISKLASEIGLCECTKAEVDAFEHTRQTDKEGEDLIDLHKEESQQHLHLFILIEGDQKVYVASRHSVEGYRLTPVFTRDQETILPDDQLVFKKKI